MNILITLTKGAIKNGYINLRGNLDKFESRYIGASGKDQHGHMLLLDIGDGETSVAMYAVRITVFAIEQP